MKCLCAFPYCPSTCLRNVRYFAFPILDPPARSLRNPPFSPTQCPPIVLRTRPGMSGTDVAHGPVPQPDAPYAWDGNPNTVYHASKRRVHHTSGSAAWY
eukprot:1832126-Rhodomonas_salina.1